LTALLPPSGGCAPAGREDDVRPVYLALIWHQHQPLYLDPQQDQLRAPWVRTHATKDYFDMAAAIGAHPGIHATVNLTSSLLVQLQNYYVERLGPFVRLDERSERGEIDAAGFLRAWMGHTDPWIDLALRPTGEWGAEGRARIVGPGWSAKSISPVVVGRWPELAELVEVAPEKLTDPELRSLLAHFYVANFDPDFLRGRVMLPDQSHLDLSDLVIEEAPDRFRFRRPPNLETTRRLVAEASRVMAAVVPEHRRLHFDPRTGEGQIEIVTTPFYHPILPLLVDSELAATAQPGVELPRPAFAYPEDAALQVAEGAAYFQQLFGTAPSGFWPGEGSVAEAVVAPFAAAGARWIATDQEVLRRSLKRDIMAGTPYRVDAGTEPGTADGEPQIALFFRETDLSDRIGFTYQQGPADGRQSAIDFTDGVLDAAARAHRQRGDGASEDLLITVILDGENAWEWYAHDNDGKHFLDALYSRLEELEERGSVVTVTPTEYLLGNPQRGGAPHPTDALPEIEPLWPGSWIGASFATWIGEAEENRAWEALREVRQSLARSGLPAPQPGIAPPPGDTSERAAWEAWQAMLAAEGSDWFWWYGRDQESGDGDAPFDATFRALLRAVGEWGRRAGAEMPVADYPSFLEQQSGGGAGGGGGVMARAGARVDVLFTVDAATHSVPDALYIVGDAPELGAWVPNVVAMYDDGSHGDAVARDGIWSLRVALPAGAPVEFKFTNSGRRVHWGTEEFAALNRHLQVPDHDIRVDGVWGELP
jgi:alpha-amylase/alpha-mannosidase (GH57 family)